MKKQLTAAMLLLFTGVSAFAAGKTPPRPILHPVVESLSVVGGTWSAQGPGPIHNGQGMEGITNKPAIGAVNAIVTHPTNADVVWIGAVNGGVWKTTNATSSSPAWTPLTDTFSSLSIKALARDWSDATYNTLVAGYGESSHFYQSGPVGALLRTTNGGTSWTALNPTALAGKGITGLAVRGSTIVATVETYSLPTCRAGFTGIYRSTDTGATFTAASGLPAQSIAYDIDGDPANGSILYATVLDCQTFDGAVYKSTNTGASWTKINSAAMNLDLWGTQTGQIAVNPSGHLFAAIVAGDLHVYRSTNQGSTWTELDSPGDGVGCLSLAADTVTSTVAYFGRCAQTFEDEIGAAEFSGRLFRVDAGAASGSQLTPLTHCQTILADCNGTTSTSSNSAPHADSRAMALDANNNLLQTDDGGVYRRTNPRGLGDWFSVNGSLQVGEVHDAVYDHVSKMIFGGNQDTGTAQQTTVGGATWTRMDGTSGDGGDVAADDTTSHTQSTRYASSQFLLGPVRHTVNTSGATTAWRSIFLTLLGGSSPAGQFVTPVELNRVDARRMLFAANNDLYESLDRGDTVTGLGLNRAAVAAVYGGRLGGVDNLDLIWAAANPSGPAVYVRTAGGGAPVQTAATPGTADLRDIAVDPADGQKAYVVNAAGQVFSTSNTGASWTNITGNLGSGTTDLRTIVFVPPGKIVVGGLYGVFVADTGSPTTWNQLGSGLPNALVYDLDYDAIDDVLVAATLGRSVWKLSPVVATGTLPSLSINDVTVTEGNSGTTNATFTVSLSASAAHTIGVQYATANSSAVAQTSSSASGPVTMVFTGDPYPSPITVSGLSDPIRKVTVTFNRFSIGNPGSVDMLLVGPGGQNVMLFSDAGGSNFIENYDLTFDDAAAAQVPQSTAFGDGTYRPTDYEPGDTSFYFPAPVGPYGSALSVFNGTSANGTWSLYIVSDGMSASVGTMDSWTLTITTGDYAPSSGQLTFPPGTTSRTITVPVYGDTSVESNETFFVNLSSPANATLADSQGVGTITNDEANAPVLTDASATTTSNIRITWNAASGAASYRVYRSSNGTTYSALSPTTTNTFFDDSTTTPGAAYLYKVRAVASSGAESGDSNYDLATAVIFGTTLTPGVTWIDSAHFTQLLSAVNAVRTLAGASPIAFTSPAPGTNVFTLAAHITDLRAGLNAARATLLLPALTYTDSTLVTTPVSSATRIKAVHLTELRNGVR